MTATQGSGPMRRRDAFFAGTRASDGVIEALLPAVRAQIEAVARSRGMDSVPTGLMDSMLAHARVALGTMTFSQVQALQSDGSELLSIAQRSFEQRFSGQSPDQIRALAASLSASSSIASTTSGGSVPASTVAATLADRLSGRAYRDMDANGSTVVVNTISGEYARAFASTGYDAATIKTFSDVGLNRRAFDQLRNEGYGKEDIAQGARSAKRLGWKGARETSALVHIGEDGQELTEETKKLIDAGQMDAAKKNVEEMQRRKDEASDPKVKDGWGVVIEKITEGHKELRQERGTDATRGLGDEKRVQVEKNADTADAGRKIADSAASERQAVDASKRGALSDDEFGVAVTAALPAAKTKAANATPIDTKAASTKTADTKPVVAKPAGPAPT